MCRDIEDHLRPARCWVHPGTTLVRSARQHLRHFETLRKKTLVLVHIGTNDIAAGTTATTVLQRMKILINSITQVNPQVMYFAISAILPRMTDNCTTKATVKQCNSMMKHWSSHTNNIVFLNTTKLFLKNRKIVSDLYRQDGLHLNQQGKQKLFTYFERFLWHFCRFKPST